MPMHFFSILQTLKLFLEIISAGRVFLVHILKRTKRVKPVKILVKMYPLTAVSSAQTVAGYHHRAQLPQSQSRCSEMNIVSSLQMFCRGGAHWLTAKRKVCLLWPSSPTRVNPSPTDIYGHVVTCTHTCLHTTRLHGDSPALPHAILVCGAAAVSHLLAVKHQGIFKTDFT